MPPSSGSTSRSRIRESRSPPSARVCSERRAGGGPEDRPRRRHDPFRPGLRRDVSCYREDFGATDGAIGRYLASFYPDGPKKQLLLGGRFRLVATDYDWTLNSQENAAKKR